ncbi:chemotaxis protein CheW [Reichenbachiella carrageenanivorans]|uniref:Chemotaxis protein CheW n=1 Tax=Reichenbachiella carrageenanivorans TaxID=2979869 RepID=A0ABY6D1B2_9BACT|nr:chemotaxis protein CheW [Reichenbachiella carrageenanivorans]UXX79504.1 chemotaxis protein CheW [Reichenbachiella carrageenanivorans]
MALGKNVKKDKLIPSKPKKEEQAVETKAVKKTASKPAKKAAPKTKKVVKEPVVKKAATKSKKTSVKPTAAKPPVESKVEVLEVAAVAESPILTQAKRVLPANFLTKEEMEQRNRLKAKYDQEIKQLKGKSIQLIVFRLGGERYALEIDKVKEIVPAPTVSQLPRAPKYMKGVANIRGSVMVIMDLEEKFELFKSEEDIKEKLFTLVIKNERFKAGILVNEVPTTLKVQGDIIESSSGIMNNTVLDETFIKGLIKNEDGMIILLDIIELIESDEVRVIAESVKDGN